MLVSPSPSRSAAAPTAPPRTGETSGRSPGTLDPARLPTYQSGLLTSFQAGETNRRMTLSSSQAKGRFMVRKPPAAFAPHLWQTFLQLGPLLLLFEQIPPSVGESCWICGFFLGMRTMRERLRFEVRPSEAPCPERDSERGTPLMERKLCHSPPAPGRVSSFPPTAELLQKALCDPRNAASNAGSPHRADSAALQ